MTKNIPVKMKEALNKLYPDHREDEEIYLAQITMLNDLRGEAFKGEFTYHFDTREEALEVANRYQKIYDIPCVEKRDEEDVAAGYFIFDNSRQNSSIYNGITAKLYYLED